MLITYKVIIVTGAGNGMARELILQLLHKDAKVTLPAEAARLIIAAKELNKPRLFIGKVSKFFDQFYRLAPTRATRFMQKQMQKFFTIGCKTFYRYLHEAWQGKPIPGAKKTC